MFKFRYVFLILFFSCKSVHAVDVGVQTVTHALSKSDLLKASFKTCINELKQLPRKISIKGTAHAARYVAGCWALCASAVNFDVLFNGGRFFKTQSKKLAAMVKAPLFALFGAVLLKPEGFKAFAKLLLRKIRLR